MFKSQRVLVTDASLEIKLAFCKKLALEGASTILLLH